MTDTSSSDLVERLRDLADYDARAGAPLGNCMLRAADRIEALEAEAERLCVVIGDNARFVCKILDEQDVEIERLREALQKIAGLSRWETMTQGCNAATDAVSIASAALGEKQ